MERIIRNNVWTDGGFLTIRDELLRQTYTMPLSSSWVVQCGTLGFKLVFGRDAETEIGLRFAWTITERECRELAPVAARTVADVIASR